MEKQLRILIVEDVPEDAELIQRELRVAGLAFEAARVDEEAQLLAALDTFRPDIVLSDYRLPRLDGMAATRLVKAKFPEIPVIIVTGSTNEEIAADCIKAGATDYVIKEHLARLAPAVRAALERADLRAEKEGVDARHRQQEERLQQLYRAVEQSPVSIVITDPSGAIEYVNPQFERVTGYTASEALGKNPSIVKSGLTPPEVYQALWRAITAGGSWQGELQNRRKDGSLFWEHVQISAVRGPGGLIRNYVAVNEDVTERRRAADALKRTQRMLMQSQKMEAIGRLAGGVAHDFNNLLSVILGHTERVREEIGPDHPSRGRIDQIAWAAEKAGGLTKQLLAFSRQQVLDPRVIRLDSVVADAREMLDRIIGEDVELVVATPESLGSVRADPGQMVQVVMNLAVNARDAMPRGGRLTIECADTELDQRYAVGHAPILAGRYVMMAVSDTGQGMDAETQRRIFEPFFTTKSEGHGTGLGLSTVYGIVKQSGGFVWVYSEVGVGTTFKVYLPRVDEPPEPIASAPQASAPRVVRDATARLLLVEDDDGVRELMADILETEGYVVVATGRPAAALELAESLGAIDLLVTDVIMPGMSGHELAAKLVERQAGLRTLYVSGYAGEALARYGGIDRSERFLQKPFSERALLDSVAAALAAA